MAARAKNAFTLYPPLLDTDGVDIRLHRTVFYNSIYLAHDELPVNTHTYATPAADTPVRHLTGREDKGQQRLTSQA